MGWGLFFNIYRSLFHTHLIRFYYNCGVYIEIQYYYYYYYYYYYVFLFILTLVLTHSLINFLLLL